MVAFITRRYVFKSNTNTITDLKRIWIFNFPSVFPHYMYTKFPTPSPRHSRHPWTWTFFNPLCTVQLTGIFWITYRTNAHQNTIYTSIGILFPFSWVGGPGRWGNLSFMRRPTGTNLCACDVTVPRLDQFANHSNAEIAFLMRPSSGSTAVWIVRRGILLNNHNRFSLLLPPNPSVFADNARNFRQDELFRWFIQLTKCLTGTNWCYTNYW